MDTDINRWNRKYLTGDRQTSLAAEPELERLQHHLPATGLALELACGKGANALYLASLGYDVVAADCAIEGLKIGLVEANRLQLMMMPVVMDFDQVALPESAFDLISVVRYLNRAMFPVIEKALKPGGYLFYKTFNQRHLQNHANFNPDFVLADGELITAFNRLAVVASNEQGNCSFFFACKR